MCLEVIGKREFTKILRDNGFYFVRTKGSHFIYKNDDGRTISYNKDLNPLVAQRLIKENNLRR